MAIESGTGPGNVSGVIVLDQLNLAKELLGEDVVARAPAHIAPDVRAEIDALLPVSWCKLTTAFAIHEAIANEIGQGVKDTARSSDVVEVVLTSRPDVPDFELDAMACGFDAVLTIAKKKHSRVTLERRPGGARFQVHLR